MMKARYPLRGLSLGFGSVVFLLAVCLPWQHMHGAVSAAEILAQAKTKMTDELWVDLGSSAWAHAIQEAWKAQQDIQGGELQVLRIALCEAWLAAGRLEQAREQLTAISTELAAHSLSPENTERYASCVLLAWTLGWRNAEKADEIISAPKALKQAGTFSNASKARAHVAEAARLIAIDQAMKSLVQYDAAYSLLKEATIDERITLLQLRLTAMEAAGLRQTAIADWFERRKTDEAVKAMAAGLFSEAQSLIGKKLPAAMFYDHAVLNIEGAKPIFPEMKGKARIIFVFTTWSKGSSESAPIIAQYLAEAGEAVDAVAVSIDTEDSVKDIPLFLQKFGLEIPVREERKAWESELIKQLHIDAIPTIMLIDKQGILHASDIHGADAAATKQRLLDSVQQVLNGAALPNADPEEHEVEDIP